MKSYLIFLSILLLSFTLNAQNSKHSHLTTDTIKLKDVVIAETMPIGNRQIENIYKKNSFATIDNVIERLDGVSMIKRGGYALEPTLNGFSAGQINITIDGMKMFGACTDKMDPITSYIEPSNLKNISVQQGAKCCKSGCSIGGSIDMALKEPENTGEHVFSGSVASAYESVSNGKTFLMSTGVVKHNWEWGLNAVYRKNDSYRDGHGDVVPFTQFEKTNVHTSLKYTFDSVNSFKADYLFDLALNVGYASLPMDVSKARAHIVGLEFKRAKRNLLLAKIYYNSVLHIMDDSKRDSAYYLTGQNGQPFKVFMRMDMPGVSTTFGAFVLSEIHLNKKNKLTVKADNYTNHALAEMTMYMHTPGFEPEPPMYLQTWPDIYRNVTGLYVENTTSFSQRYSLSVSGRLDYNIDFTSSLARDQFSVFDLKVKDNYHRLSKAFIASGLFNISRSVSFTGELGYAERIPTITESFGYYLYNAYDGYDYIGNPNLKTEKSVSGKFIFSYSIPKLKIKLNQSYNHVMDYIMGIPDSLIPSMNFYTNGTKVYRNVAGADIYNANLQFMVTPFKAFSIFILTKYTWGQLNTGDPMPLIAPLSNIISVSYEPGRWLFSVENQLALRQNRINVNYGEITSPAYTIFNVKAGYTFKIRKRAELNVTADVSNLLNAVYYEHLDWGRIYRPGRSFNFYLRFLI